MINVLLIEDDSALQQAFALTLGFQGYKVVTAGNGQEGLERLQEYTPDIILLDVIMPIMDGVEFLENAHLDGSIPVITFSNLSGEKKKSDMAQLGSIKHVLKSDVSPKDLDILIRDVLKKK